MSIESSGEYFKVKAVAVWLPVLLGLPLSIISMLALWVGLWLSMTFAILNVWHRQWSKSHTEAKEM